MDPIERALKTAMAQIEEAEGTARIRNAYFQIVVSNAQTLFEVFSEAPQKKELVQALANKNIDGSMLYRGLLIQVNGIFEKFVHSICEAVLVEKARKVSFFCDMEEKVRSEYIHKSAIVLTYAKKGNVRGASYDFGGLQTSLARCFLGEENFQIKADVFTKMMGNCTSSKLKKLFEALCLTDPFSDRIGTHPGLKSISNERSKRKVANFAMKTLDEQIKLRNDIAHGNLTKSISSNEFQFSIQFYKGYMEAITSSTKEDISIL